MTMPQETDIQKAIKKLEREQLKRTFETLWKQLGGPELIEEFVFHPTRAFRFDYVATGSKLVAIELEGGTWLEKSGHTTGKGYAKDCIKYNQAQLLGYHVFRFTTDMLANDPVGHLLPVIELIREASNA